MSVATDVMAGMKESAVAVKNTMVNVVQVERGFLIEQAIFGQAVHRRLVAVNVDELLEVIVDIFGPARNMPSPEEDGGQEP